MMDLGKVEQAINLIEQGLTKRIDLENVKVYAVGENVIRIDIKREVK